MRWIKQIPGKVFVHGNHRLLVLSGFLCLPPLLLPVASRSAEEKSPANTPIFEKDIMPILQAKCLRCHGAEQQKADLDLRTKTTLLKGGESGTAISPGSAERSTLWVKVAADKMPPGMNKLTEAEKELIRTWLETGARDNGTAVVAEANTDRQITDAERQFWAFQKPIRSAIPAVQHTERVRNPIDAFILAALEKTGLTLSPEADRLVLLRRAYLDLIGLPPSPRAIEEYQADTADDAYERLIDRLLASHHFGERWARHWLDVAGYADSEGILDADYVRTAAWRYRDYVIRALNQDKPYDRFLKEQLAGDELVDYWTAYRTQQELRPEVLEAIIATGYIRCASDTSRPDFVNIKNAPGYYYQTLDDTVKIVASSLLGLTVQCAKCHSHKYDPIPQSDYYRIQAIFMSGYRPYQWVPQVERRRQEATEVQEKEANEHNAKIDAAIAPLRKQLTDFQQQYSERLFQERLAQLPEVIREDVRTALYAEAAKRTEVQKYLAEKFQKDLRPEPRVLDRTLEAKYPEYKSKRQPLEAAIRVEDAKRRTFAEIRAFYDLPGEAKTHLLRRGDYLNPGPEVQPGVLSVVAATQPFTWTPPPKDSPSSGRRRAFAEWLTQPDHPLTARVLVNRLWLHHFGEGLVATADNFGHAGAPPSHPQLLDWLATEFVARGWSLKALHRLILTSSTYRQTSMFDPVAQATAKQVDPENRLLWRQRLRRLEAEVLRDAILSVSGTLNRQMFGPPVPMQRQPNGEVTTPADASGLRRSIYLQIRRSQPLTLLQVFDQPVMETNCTHRATSTVSSQALTLLNSDFLMRQAEAFAMRVLRENPSAPAAYALQLALARRATETERLLFANFLETQALRYVQARIGGPAPTTSALQGEARQRELADLCQMLLSSNEFAYVD
jgi:hypothetical protein